MGIVRISSKIPLVHLAAFLQRKIFGMGRGIIGFDCGLPLEGSDSMREPLRRLAFQAGVGSTSILDQSISWRKRLVASQME